jgi:hypothetical protein
VCAVRTGPYAYRRMGRCVMDSQELYEVLFDAVMSCDGWPQELSEKSDTVIGAYEMLGHYLVGRAMELKGQD